MALLPKKTGAARRFAGGGDLNMGSYQARGGGLGGALGGAGDALYQNLPPLAIPYIDVKRAAPVDTAAAVASQDEAGKKQADALLKELDKKLQDSLKDARMTASGASEWSLRTQNFLRKVQGDVSKNPAILADPTYRTQFALDTQQLLDPGSFNSKRNVYDDYGNLRSSAKAQLNDRAIINGVRQVLTNDQLITRGLRDSDLRGTASSIGLLPRNASEQDMQSLQGRDLSGHLIEALKGSVQEGDFDDTQKVVQAWRAGIQTSESGHTGKHEGVGQVATGDPNSPTEMRVLSSGAGSATTSNAARIRELEQTIKRRGWQAALGNPKAVNGMYKAMNDRVDGQSLGEGNALTLADGTVLPDNTNRYQAEMLALNSGDTATYRKLMDQREELVSERAIDYLNQELNLHLVNGTKTTSEDGIGGKVGSEKGSSASMGDLGFRAQVDSGSPNLNWTPVNINDTEGKSYEVTNPITGKKTKGFGAGSTSYLMTRFPEKDQLEVEKFFGIGSEQRKTLADVSNSSSSILISPNRPLYQSNTWLHGIDPKNLEVVGFKGVMRIPDPTFAADYARLQKQENMIAQDLQNTSLPAKQRAYLEDLQKKAYNTRLSMSVPYQVLRVATDVRTLKDANDGLAYTDKDGKTVKPLLDENILAGPGGYFNNEAAIRENNPYEITTQGRNDRDASKKGDDSWVGRGRPVTFTVYRRSDNESFNDGDQMRAGNNLPEQVRQAAQDIREKLDRLYGNRAELNPAPQGVNSLVHPMFRTK